MKLVIDERLKHRLIGLAVIISLGAIFAPAVMRKSSQRPEGNFSVNVSLPEKPLVPNVVMSDEKEMFKTIKITRVDIPAVSDKKQLPELVKAEPITSDVILSATGSEVAKASAVVASEPMRLALVDSAKKTFKKEITLASKKPAVAKVLVQKPQVKTSKIVAVAKPSIQKDIYAVQLASFSQISNAQTLVSRLHSRGYKANFKKQGNVYKVYAGHSPLKVNAMKLKVQLASAMQLNGFVVNTGVS